MQNILITTSSFGDNDPEILDKIKLNNLNPILNPFKRKLTENEVIGLFKEYQPVGIVAGVEPLTRKVLEIAKNLKVISRCGIGMDSVDLETAKELSIVVKNTPDAPTISVAELTLGMILSLLRQINTSDTSIRNGNWNRPMGNLLYKKTVGIIGCGRIGSHLAKLLKAFECKILGYDTIKNKEDLFTYVDLDTLITRSDIISLHLPYCEDTHHFINAEKISKMKSDAIIVNAARGGLIDEAALYEALESNGIRGACLDCFEQEPYKGNLVNLSNTLLTAHIGSYAVESRMMMENQAVENLLEALK